MKRKGGVRKRARTIHGISLDCVDGDVVVLIPRLPLTLNAVCEDLKPERKIGAKQRVARDAIFRFLEVVVRESGDTYAGRTVNVETT